MKRKLTGKRKDLRTALLVFVLAVMCFGMAPKTEAAAEHHDYTAEELLEVLEGIMEWQKDVCGYDELFNKEYLKSVNTPMGDWFAFAAGRSGYETDAISYRAVLEAEIIKKYENKEQLGKATECHRSALTLLALGGDPTKVTDGQMTIDLIADGTYNRGKVEALDTQGSNGAIWGLLTLDAMRYTVPADAADTRETMLEMILAAQQEDGGFALSDDADAIGDVDITGMALQALAPYIGRSEQVRAAVDKALSWLSKAQQADGGFGSTYIMEEETIGGSSESCAQVLTALCTLGIDAGNDSRFIKNGNTVLDALMSYRQKDGGFVHSYEYDEENPSSDPNKSNFLASGQTAYAITALCRYYGNMRKLYDLRPEQSMEVKEQIRAVEEQITNLSKTATADEVKKVLTAYEEIPAEENSYVSNIAILAEAADQVNLSMEDNLTEGMDQNTEGCGTQTTLSGETLKVRIVFSEEDAAAVQVLPDTLTTEYANEVSRLLGKLHQAENGSDYEELIPVLQDKREKIEEIETEITDINTWILENLYPIEELKSEDQEELEDLDERIKALSEYDRAQITAYEDVKRALTSVSNQGTAQVIKVAAIAILIVLIVIFFVRVFARRKKMGDRNQEDDDDEDDEEV